MFCNSILFQVRGKVATPRVGLCVLLLLLALLVSINIGLTLWLLFTVRLDLVSSCFISLCFGNLLWLQMLQPSLSEWWRSSHFRARRAQDRRIHAGDFFQTLDASTRMLSSTRMPQKVVGDLVTDKLTSGTRRLTLRGDRYV